MSNKYQTIKAEFDRLIEKHGRLTPEIIVQEASKKDSKLHPFFTWNNAKAAHAWRLEQASYFLRSIKVTIEAPDGSQTKARAYVSIRQEEEESDDEDMSGRGEYMPLEVVLQDSTMSAQMMDDAKRELRSFQRKYQTLKALTPVMEAIDELLGVAQG